MDELKELVTFVSQQKVKQIEIVTDDSTFKGKSRKLYDFVRKEDIYSDEAAMKAIYGKSDKVNYRKLKYRLKQKLINSVFFTDINNYGRSANEKGQVLLIKNWAACEILTLRGLNQISWTLAEKILHSAIKLDRLEIAIHISKNLRRKYGVNQFDKSKFEKYNGLTKSLMEKYSIELELQEFFVVTVSHIVNKYKLEEGELLIIENRISQLGKVIDDYTNYHIKFFYYNTLFYINLIKKNVKKQNEICDEALEYFSSRNDIPRTGQYSFILKKGVASLQAKDLETADDFFKRAINFGKTTSVVMWQYRYNYLSLIQFLKKEYHLAYDSIANIVNDKRFHKLKSILKENWYIKEAYLHFLIKAGRLDESSVKKKINRKFRLNRFLNEVPVPSKDKTGYNLSINIIQILFLILDKEHDLVYSRLEALKQYGYRYLKGEQHIRSRTFIKMLQKLKNGAMNLDAVEKKAEKYLEILNNNPSDYSDETLQIEIIPYEQLWEELLYAL